MIIGLCGAAGCGKNTVAGILGELYGFEELSFAEPLYAAVAAITGVPVDVLRDRAVKDSPLESIGRTPRFLLQSLGTEWGRGMVSDTIWIDILGDKARSLDAAGRHVVISDVRFDNEAAFIKTDLGGRIWKITRGAGVVETPEMRHASESGISEILIDKVIGNWSGLERLRMAVAHLAVNDLALYGRRKATIRE